MDDRRLQPPSPAVLIDQANVGRQLLSLTRTLEKESDFEVLSSVIDLWQNQIATSQRLGLLQGRQEMADKVIAVQQSKQAQSKRAGKRKRPNDLSIQQDTLDADEATDTLTLDVNLLFAAALRILTIDGPHRGLMSTAVADWLTACVQALPQSQCRIAEYELLASSGKQLLSGLQSTIALFSYQVMDCETAACLFACLRAAAALVGLFGTKLSRSTALLDGLATAAYKVLVVEDHRVQQASAMLLSVIPRVGGTQSPAIVWSLALVDCSTALRSLQTIVVPLLGDQEIHSISDKILSAQLDDWISMIRSTDDEKARADLLVSTLQALHSVVVALLAQTCGSGDVSSLLESEIKVPSMLDLIEGMLSFPSAAEAVYFGTKKRLRQETIDGGLLSAAVIVSDVANRIKFLGMNLLLALIEAAGGPALLPFATRIKEMAAASLSTACSSKLRKVLDPTAPIQRDGKRSRWLHESITVRAAAVDVLSRAIAAFGVDQCNRSTTSMSMNETEKAISMVAGCLVEQLLESTTATYSAEWGSAKERSDLLVAASRCLSTCLASGGEYLHEGLRSMLDSVTVLCFEAVTKGSMVTAVASVKQAVIELGVACINTPWPDGAASDVGDALLEVSRVCATDRDPMVAQSAAMAIRICEALCSRRVPALQTITRSHGSSLHNRVARFLSIDDLVMRLDSVRKEEDRLVEEEQARKTPAVVEVAPKKAKPIEQAQSHQGDAAHETKPIPGRLEQESRKTENGPPSTPPQASSGESVADQVATPTILAHVKAGDHETEGDEELDFPVIVNCGPDHGDEDSD